MSTRDVILQYGEAFRGDWSDVDGRTVRYEMETIVRFLDEGGKDAALRAELGLCQNGEGHWEHWCFRFHGADR